MQSIIHLSPVLTEILEQGIEEGIFSTSYPQETIELLLSSAQVIFDEGYSMEAGRNDEESESLY